MTGSPVPSETALDFVREWPTYRLLRGFEGLLFAVVLLLALHCVGYFPFVKVVLKVVGRGNRLKLGHRHDLLALHHQLRARVLLKFDQLALAAQFGLDCIRGWHGGQAAFVVKFDVLGYVE